MANEINFTPIVFGAAADEDVFNDPLRELDTAIKKNTWNATSAPTVNDDSTDGYSIGSRWMDVSTAAAARSCAERSSMRIRFKRLRTA